MPRPRLRNSSNTLAPNLTPLLDLVLQLITFFMMLVHFGTRIEGATREVRLPVAPAALPGEDMAFDRMIVELDARGRILGASGAIEENRTAAWWADQAKLRRAGLEALGAATAGNDVLPTQVIVRADRDAPYGALRRVLAAAQDRGFAHFRFVVLKRVTR